MMLERRDHKKYTVLVVKFVCKNRFHSTKKIFSICNIITLCDCLTRTPVSIPEIFIRKTMSKSYYQKERRKLPKIIANLFPPSCWGLTRIANMMYAIIPLICLPQPVEKWMQDIKI